MGCKFTLFIYFLGGGTKEERKGWLLKDGNPKILEGKAQSGLTSPEEVGWREVA